ncbi:MAG TPA: maltose alpha-D-glucosyltransferase [Verrucomicrobiae bacterium]|nr:maltose alpha-D-glucosyltransferase [Verrucomicrobiae bacterium]
MPAASPNRQGLDRDPFWYKNGVIYEVHVRAFFDANGDGSGDFRGLTEKLDYIKDLGVTAIWLLPFYPSPLKDDGYDIADYCNVHPMFGTLGDFKMLLREAHKRGLRIITELVLNHTSDQHPWFQRARRAKPGSQWRNFYVWSDTTSKYKDTRIIFKDVEVSNWTWDHEARAYFWHRFFSHQPDLNYDHPEVHKAMFKVVDFWLDLGVDGLRLDAVPYLYEREGTNCENLPETHAFLKKLRAHVDGKYRDRMLLAEANQWPEDAVAYFGQGRGDECHMAYHFPLMPRLFMALRMEDRLPIVDILEQTPPIPETSQWALFLRNHDELTLEMVTDEERDYMYRMYAQVHQARLNLGIRRRLAPLLNNDRKSIELLNALLFSLPGTPVLYYGDEIGLGENIYLGDRDGVRTPMQWSSDKNAGFSRANPQSLYLPIILDPSYHYEAVNVETQMANPHSQLWWTRRILALRKRWRALGEGKCEFLQPDNNKILSYILRHEQGTILVVANLSRFTQPVELDLSAFKTLVPIELFGRTKFPAITEESYFLTLGPHNFFWFSLEPKVQPPTAQPATDASAPLPAISVTSHWQDIFTDKPRAKFEALLLDYLKSRSWFAAKAGTLKLVTLKEVFNVPLPGETTAALALLQIEYVDANAELFVLPLAFAAGTALAPVRENAIAALTLPEDPHFGVVHEAFVAPAFAWSLLELIRRRERLHNERGEVEAMRLPASREILNGVTAVEPSVQNTDEGNATLVFGEQIVLKFFRRPGSGVNPELELGRFLTEKNFPHSPKLLGALEYHADGEPPMTLAVAKAFVPHAKNGWKFTLDAITRYYDRVFADAAQGHNPSATPAVGPLKPGHNHPAAEAAEHVETYLESARLLGERTAELHLALASGEEGGEFFPEPMTPYYLRGTFQSMRSLAVQNLRLLRKQLKALPPELVPSAERVAGLESGVLQHYHRLIEQNFEARRIRIHGDLHLGQLLWTGRDFVFLDFEGDATVPISQRRLKRSPLRDVARMLRSFHHAAYAGFHQQVDLGVIARENLTRFEPWVRHWNVTVSRAYLQAYFRGLEKSEILPRDEGKLRVMLMAYLLNQVMDELGCELRRHSDNVRAPLQAILFLMEERLPLHNPTPHPGATDAPAQTS